MNIRSIQNKIQQSNYQFSDHAVKQMIERSIDRYEVEDAICSGKIIEEYPDDKYSPSCLIYGKIKSGRDLHVQVSFIPKVIIITTYEPDPEEWINCQIMR